MQASADPPAPPAQPHLSAVVENTGIVTAIRQGYSRDGDWVAPPLPRCPEDISWQTPATERKSVGIWLEFPARWANLPAGRILGELTEHLLRPSVQRGGACWPSTADSSRRVPC